ncbi:MAG TPA: DoxX family protein [Gemmatimonadales bacterium]|nr:DoxX family protein [Gemmatimonadales bacterium]
MDFFAQLHHLSNWGLVALRLGVGVTFLVHGIQKRAMWKMQPSAQMPASLLSIIRLLSIAEPMGGLAVLTGFLTQLAAAGFVIVMLGAINLKARQMHKHFSGDGGWELDYSLLAAAIALLILGAGGISIDRLLFGL